jgi:hypothetical protein
MRARPDGKISGEVSERRASDGLRLSLLLFLHSDWSQPTEPVWQFSRKYPKELFLQFLRDWTPAAIADRHAIYGAYRRNLRRRSREEHLVRDVEQFAWNYRFD